MIEVVTVPPKIQNLAFYEVGPEISTFLCCHNHGRFVTQAIDSILRQTLIPKELILIDDGSTDNTWDMFRKYEQLEDIRVILVQHQQKVGHINSYNEGIFLSSGDYVHLMAADDYFNEKGRKFYERAVAVMEKDPEVGYVSCGLHQVGYDGVPMFQVARSQVGGTLEPYQVLSMFATAGNFTNGGGTMVRMEAQKDLSYDPSFPRTADFINWIRILRKGWKAHYLRDVMYCYRRHLDQMTAVSARDPGENEAIMEELRNALQEFTPRGN